MKNFYYGAIWSASLLMMHQDYLGQKEYSRLINSHWVRMNWAWWLIPVIAFSVMAAINAARDDAALSR